MRKCERRFPGWPFAGSGAIVLFMNTSDNPFPTEAPEAFADFAALETRLQALGLFRMTPGIERVSEALERLGLRRPPYTVVQVVGTNGKGSTSTMLATLAQEHGLRVGLHCSPHFLSPRERVRVNGAMLEEEQWRRLGNHLMRHDGEQLSYFEFITCLAALAFAEAGADLAVMETGLGGSYDAVTAFEADLLLFTPIALDHQLVLGPNLTAIAADKAGAIRPGVPVFSAAQAPEAWEQLAARAEERAAPLHLVSAEEYGLSAPERFPLHLEGEHQQENARLALAAWRHLRAAPRPEVSRGTAISEQRSVEERAVAERSESRAELNNVAERPAIRSASDIATELHGHADTALECLEGRALARAWLPGRLQHIAPAVRAQESTYAPCQLGWPPLLLDGAHNSHGLAALGHCLARQGIAPAAVIFTCLRDKDPRHLLPHLRVLATGPIFVPPLADNPRAMPPEELAAAIGLSATPVSSFKEALEAAAKHMAERLPEAFGQTRSPNPLLICGSLYLLGEFYALRPDCLEQPRTA